mgnify:CR=1 FL=1
MYLSTNPLLVCTSSTKNHFYEDNTLFVNNIEHNVHINDFSELTSDTAFGFSVNIILYLYH